MIRIVTGHKKTYDDGQEQQQGRQIRRKAAKLVRKQENLKRRLTETEHDRRQAEMLLQIMLYAAAELEWWGHGEAQTKEKQ